MSEKADTKPIDSSEASQTNKAQLPNTGSASSQAAVAAGLALLGLSAGLVVTKGKKKTRNFDTFFIIKDQRKTLVLNRR